MNKILRISMIAVLAFIANFSFGQEVTLDFTNNTTWKFPEGNTNGATEAAQFSNGTYTITVEAPTAYYWFPSNSALLYGKKDATITLPKFNFDVERIDIIGAAGASGKTTRNIFVGNTAVSTETKSAKGTHEYEIKADNQAANTEYIIKVTNANNDQIQKILIWKKGTTKPTETPTAANIAAFKALASGTTATLTLKNAQVVYKNVYTTKSGATNTEYYVRDASGAILFFNTDLELNVNQVINGTVEVTYSPFNELPQATKTANTSAEKLTITDGETAVPTKVTVADLTSNKYLCDLVTVENANIISETSGTYTNQYLTNGTDKVMIYDKFKTKTSITDGEGLDVTGILVTAKLSGNIIKEFAPISAPIPTGINNITTDATLENAPAFNLAGQKVGKAYKGVVIKAGKKFIQK